MNAAQMLIPLTYLGAWLEGNLVVPRNGPHCPIRLIITMETPRRLSLPWLSKRDLLVLTKRGAHIYSQHLLRVSARMFGMVENTPAEARKVAK